MSEETKKPQITEQEVKASIKVDVPSTKDLLKAGVQFGHETKRWNPKMKKYIFGEKNKIHVIDIDQTQDMLEKAAKFLAEAASRGGVLFVGTKRQASSIIKEQAIRCGAYYVDERWAGGLLTNFSVVKKSISNLRKLEESFETGVEDRTKFEVSRMKKDWQRLSRLYSGIKSLNGKPSAILVVDAQFEKSAVREARKIGAPIVGIVDTNSDPDIVDYLVPANDDAIGSISILIKTLADAVLAGNRGNGIKHNLKDYSKVEIKITKHKELVNEDKGITIALTQEESPLNQNQASQDEGRSRRKVKGILERVKEEAEKKVEKKVEKKSEPKTKKSETKKIADKKVEKKTVAKKETKPASKKTTVAKKSKAKKTVKK